MILLYQASEATKKVLTEMQLAYRIIDDSMLHETLGYLFQFKGFDASEQQSYHFDFDAMILHDLDDDTINEMVMRLKKEHANIARKAVLTKHNQYWKMGDLLAEINTEHEYFLYCDTIMALLKRAETLHLEDYDPVLWNSYQTAFVKAYEVLQSRPEDIRLLMQAHADLQKAELALSQT